MDGSGGAYVVNVGHGVSEIADAMACQARTLAYVTGTAFTHDAVEELAAEIARLSPGDLELVYPLASGSEAVEAGLKLARQYWVESGRPKKHKVLAFAPSYHGNTLLALSASSRERYKAYFRESRENFTRQHDVRDTFEGISLPYLAQNARVNAAAAATLALAPPPPSVLSERNQPLITRAPSGYDANLKWNAAPGAAAYRIFWREAWGPDWQHELLVGNVTNVVLPNMQIDDYVFGVAAVDAQLHCATPSCRRHGARGKASRRCGHPLSVLGIGAFFSKNPLLNLFMKQIN